MSIYLRSIGHRFGPRLSEWFVAGVTFLWGVVLLFPADTFTGDSWVIFRAIMPEQDWGILMLALGLARLTGLVVNGARRKVTPYIRMVSAGCGVGLFVGISAGFYFSGVIGTWIAVYPMIVVLELFNIHRAAHDAGETDATAASRAA